MIEQFASWIVSLIGLTGNAASALQFWIYDSIKILLILFLVVFAVGYLRTYVSAQKIRDYLKNKHKFTGYILAALLGIISPFCSCSTIPIFIGFVSAGIPFGMVITFLFVSPMVNEAAVAVLFGTLGWEVTLAYVLGGIVVAISGSLILSKLGFGKYIKKFRVGENEEEDKKMTFKERINMGYKEGKSIIKTIFPYVLIGIGIGAIIHGYLPEEVISNYLQSGFAVPLAVLLGVPIYTNIMGVIPVTESLIGKGLPIGTALAFMMSVAALSLPEFIMLSKVMEKKLLIAYGVILSLGIMIVGFILNSIF